MPRQTVIHVMRRRKNDATGNGHQGVGEGAVTGVSNGSAKDQYRDTRSAPGNYRVVAMAPEPLHERKQADWYHDQQHLRVEMRCIDLVEQWQEHNDDG